MQPHKIATLAGHQDCIYALATAHDNRYCFSADGHGKIAMWDLAKPEIGELVAQVPNSVYALCPLPAQAEMLIGQNFEGLHHVNYAEKSEIRSLKITDNYVFDIQLQDDTAWVALGDGSVVIVDLVHWIVRKTIKMSDKSARCMAFHPAGEQVAVGYSDCAIRVFSRQGILLHEITDAHKNSVFTLAYSPDGAHLLSGSRDAHLKIWQTAENYALEQSIAAHLFAINKIVYSPDGQYFATGSMDKAVKIWEAKTFRLLKVLDKARHAGHGNSVNTLLWSPYQAYLLSAGDDKMVGVWQLEG